MTSALSLRATRALVRRRSSCVSLDGAGPPAVSQNIGGNLSQRGSFPYRLPQWSWPQDVTRRSREAYCRTSSQGFSFMLVRPKLGRRHYGEGKRLRPGRCTCYLRPLLLSRSFAYCFSFSLRPSFPSNQALELLAARAVAWSEASGVVSLVWLSVALVTPKIRWRFIMADRPHSSRCDPLR